jgi:hypothetical protein
MTSVLEKRTAPEQAGTARTVPTFLLIGAMRAGTTSLSMWLARHSQIYVAPEKELYFFDARYDRGWDWYLKQFPGMKGHRAIGEATPHYMYKPEALERIAQDLPGVRLVATIRNPIDRAYSHFWWNKARSWEDLGFEHAIDAEPGRISDVNRKHRNRYSYLDRGQYARQVETVYRYFPRTSLKVVLLDDLKSKPRETYQDLCRFLGVDPEETPEEVGSQVNGYVSFRWLKVNSLVNSLPPRLRGAVGRLNDSGQKYPEMAPETRRRLVEHFRPANAALGRLLGRDMSDWDR